MLLAKQTAISRQRQKVLFLFVFFLCIAGDNQPLLSAETGQLLTLVKDGHLRVRPGFNNKVTHPVRKGTPVIRKGRQPGWSHVFVPSMHRSGWLPDRLLSVKPSVPVLRPQNAKKSFRKAVTPRSRDTRIPVLTGELMKQPTSSIAVLDVQKIIDESQRGRDSFLTFRKLSAGKSPQETARAEQEVLTRIIMEIRMLAELYAAQHHLTHIINKNSASLFHYDPRFEITDEILQLYDKQAGERQ